MEQSYNNIILNSIYRTCFKNIVPKHDREINQVEKLGLANCFIRLTEAYKIIAPGIASEFKANRSILLKKAGEAEAEAEEEGGEEATDDSE